MAMQTLNALRVRYLAGDLTTEQLLVEAARMISSVDSRALLELMNDELVTPELIRELLRKAVVEAGISDDLNVAIKTFVRDVAEGICHGEIKPYDGARVIWRAALLVPGSHEYDPFIYAASEHEDRLEDRGFFDEAIVDEACRLLNAKR